VGLKLGGAPAARIRLYKGTGMAFIAAAEREWKRREAENERLSSHLVVLKTPGMLLL